MGTESGAELRTMAHIANGGRATYSRPNGIAEINVDGNRIALFDLSAASAMRKSSTTPARGQKCPVFHVVCVSLGRM